MCFLRPYTLMTRLTINVGHKDDVSLDRTAIVVDGWYCLYLNMLLDLLDEEDNE